MIIPVVWALAASLNLHVKAVPPPPQPKPVPWVLMAFIPKADVFQYEFTSLAACQGGVEELKKLVPGYYVCVRTGE